MKRFFLYAACMIILFLLQTTVFQWFSLAGVAPNLLVILTVTVGLLEGSIPGIFCGMCCGLIIDCMYGNVIGLYALFYMMDGYLTGIVQRFYSPQEEYGIPLLLVGAGDLLYNMLYYISEFLLRSKFGLATYMLRIIIPEMVYTLLVAVFLYKFIFWARTRLINSGKEEE